MTRIFPALGRGALAASAALSLGMASPVLAAPGKDGHARKMMGHHQMCGPHGDRSAGRLTVTGQGESRIAPDMAMVQLGVTTQAETAAEAMRENSTRQTAVIEALKGAGVAETDVQTSGLSLNPMMDYGENRTARVTGYQASNMVGVRVTDMAILGPVLDAIVGAGANEINGITFGREDSAGAKDEARREAVADARHKAEVLAEAAGLELGRVLLLRDSEMSDGPRPMMRMAAEAAGAADSVPVQAGELSMSANVQIEYALIGGVDDCGGTGGKGHGGPADDMMPPSNEDAAPPDAETDPAADGEAPSN